MRAMKKVAMNREFRIVIAVARDVAAAQPSPRLELVRPALSISAKSGDSKLRGNGNARGCSGIDVAPQKLFELHHLTLIGA